VGAGGSPATTHEGIMSHIYILGNGGFAQEVFEQIILNQAVKETFGGFVILKNDEAVLIGEEGANPFTYPASARFIIGTGNKYWRKTFIDRFTSHYQTNLYHFPNVEAPYAYVSKTSYLGVGNVFMNFSVLNGNAAIGNFNMLYSYSSIHHDTIIGNNNIFSPYAGVMGYCKVGNDNFLGTGTHLTPKVYIGNENTLSAGETVFDDMKTRQFFQHGLVLDKKS
jgi:UDP-3-O-[3-hydroxymyristoyl] glucosamine N-acyltransferase